MTGEERELYRRVASDLAKTYEPDTLAKLHDAAADQIQSLRVLFPGESEDSMARMARMSVMVIKQLATLPIYMAGDTMDHSVASYAFACGSLAGVYVLPGQEKPEPDKRAVPGQYL